jgi:hypothetical protein
MRIELLGEICTQMLSQRNGRLDPADKFQG